jgi:hypothetical protein
MAKKHTKPLRESGTSYSRLRDRFGRLERIERRELRIALHDGASIGELLLLLMVGCVHLDLIQVERFLGLTHARAKDLLNSVRKRLDNYSSARDHESEIESFADSRRSGRKGKMLHKIEQEK